MSQGIIGIIGGTGLADAFARRLKDVQPRDLETPFGRPSAPILLGKLGANKIAFLNRHGPGHRLDPSRVPYAANIFALKQLGAAAVISSGAVGSLRADIHPCHLVLVDQFIDKTFRRQGSFFDDFGAVHCEMAHPCCRRLRDRLIQSASRLSLTVHHRGTYLCMEGPHFSTRAESLMHRTWGAELVGMTALPEAKLARQAQMCYALIAMVSDYDCWREHPPQVGQQSLLEEIIENLHTATDNAMRLIETLLEGEGELCDDSCPCRKSLSLAVWTRPDAVDAEQKRRLAVLFE